MRDTLPTEWQILLNDFLQSYNWKSINDLVEQDEKLHTVLPHTENRLRAFTYFKPSETKVVIIGQDPYHTEGCPNGLCFAVNQGVKIPPSLRNIFKELNNEYNTVRTDTALIDWAKQGVLLLNSILTVRQGHAASHSSFGWEDFTDFVIKKLSDNHTNIVFLLWGNYAIKKSGLIDETKHLILSTTHPSPFSANKGFLNCNHFKSVNNYLQSKNKAEIKWV